MAGVGFELRKSIESNHSSEKVKGYLGAAFSSSGSMLVGIVLFALVQVTARFQNVSQATSDQFMCYVTNAMFLSMIVVSLVSLPLSRYVSNALYLGKNEKVMPSFIGGTVVVSVLGGALFLLQLILSHVAQSLATLLLILFLVLEVCWLLMTYITIIRDYGKIVLAYFTAFLVAIIYLGTLSSLTTLTIGAMLSVLLVGFSVVDIFLFWACYRAFSNQDGSIFEFIDEIKVNPSLVGAGFLMMLGMLGHFLIVWFFSDTATEISTLFRFNEKYDFPAIVAYFSTIPAAIYFITGFETSFSEKYLKYFSLLGQSGTVGEVNNAKEEMVEAIITGIKKIFLIELVSCLFFITFGAKFLAVINIGMTESMLSSFRLFCVGYSLYYLGNTLMLLLLYFTNEKKAVWVAGAFAAVVNVGSWFCMKYVRNSWGLAFTVASVFLVICCGSLLVKFLSKLEFNILCRAAYQPSEFKGTADSRQRHDSRRKKGILSAACITLAVFVGSGGWLIRDAVHQSMVLTFSPAASTEVLLSPGMGLAPWADSDDTLYLKTSLVYVELKWSDWEPEDDVFNVDFVNEYYNLDFYREDGRQVVFRFICDEPTDEEHMDIPQWLYDATDGDGQFYDIEYGIGYSPNYSNETFIEEHGEAIAALGEAYGQDDFFVYVELGSLGHWGEWHVDYESGITQLPEYATRERYVRPYLNAFPNAKFLLRYQLMDAVQYSMGLFNDLTGDYDETMYWLSQKDESVWEQTGEAELADCSEVWKTLPIGGEFAQTYQNSYFMRKEFDRTLEAIVMSHQSFIGPKIIIDEGDDHYTEQMNKILKTIGYRYRVDSVKMDFTEKESFQITCTVVNDGIAPIYDSYSVQVVIYDTESNPIWSMDELDIDLRNITPDKSGVFTVSAPKDEFDDDSKYILAISVVDSNERAVVPMAMAEQLQKNVYKIAEFMVP